MNSNFLSINWSDAIKGLVIAVLTAVLTGLLKIFETGALPTLADLQTIGIIAITAGLSYILKNLLTNSDGKMMKKETANDTN